MNCCVVPGATAGFAGVTAIETRATPTVRFADPAMLPSFALTVQAPDAIAVTNPPGATVIAAVDELQVAVLVRSVVLPLL